MTNTQKHGVAAVAAVIGLAALLAYTQAGRFSRKPTPTPTKLTWHNTLTDALEEAKAGGNLVLVDVYATWCPWCKELDEKTLTDATVSEKLSGFSLVKVDWDKHEQLARGWGADNVPTSVVLDANGEVVLLLPGYVPPKVYVKFLNKAIEKANNRPT